MAAARRPGRRGPVGVSRRGRRRRGRRRRGWPGRGWPRGRRRGRADHAHHTCHVRVNLAMVGEGARLREGVAEGRADVQGLASERLIVGGHRVRLGARWTAIRPGHGVPDRDRDLGRRELPRERADTDDRDGRGGHGRRRQKGRRQEQRQRPHRGDSFQAWNAARFRFGHLTPAGSSQSCGGIRGGRRIRFASGHGESLAPAARARSADRQTSTAASHQPSRASSLPYQGRPLPGPWSTPSRMIWWAPSRSADATGTSPSPSISWTRAAAAGPGTSGRQRVGGRCRRFGRRRIARPRPGSRRAAQTASRAPPARRTRRPSLDPAADIAIADDAMRRSEGHDRARPRRRPVAPAVEGLVGGEQPRNHSARRDADHQQRALRGCPSTPGRPRRRIGTPAPRRPGSGRGGRSQRPAASAASRRRPPRPPRPHGE